MVMTRFTWNGETILLSTVHIRAVYTDGAITAIDVADAGSFNVDQTPDEVAKILGT